MPESFSDVFSGVFSGVESGLFSQEIPSSIIFPDPLIQGDTWCFRLLSGQYSLFTASITFAAATTKLTSAASLVDNFFAWNIPSSQTSALAPQPYAYNVNVTDTLGNRLTIQTGAVVVAPDISVASTNVANRTSLELMLLACDQSLISLLSQTMSMVMFAGQEYHFYDVAKLFEVRDILVSRIADEQEVLEGNRRNRRVVTRFVNM